MAQELDVYRDWLGIKETTRPLDNYQILRLKRFEDDTSKIRSHYQKMNEHVRKFALGEHAVRSQELLNELAKAMLCLTDQQRKREYDAALGRNVEDRADAAHAAALGAAWLGVDGLPQSITVVRTKLLSKLPAPTLPARVAATAGAA